MNIFRSLLMAIRCFPVFFADECTYELVFFLAQVVEIFGHRSLQAKEVAGLRLFDVAGVLYTNGV